MIAIAAIATLVNYAGHPSGPALRWLTFFTGSVGLTAKSDGIAFIQARPITAAPRGMAVTQEIGIHQEAASIATTPRFRPI